MMTRSLFWSFFIMLLGGLYSSSPVNGQNAGAGGLPLQYYTSKVYEAKAQSWDIVQDQRGILYFANNGGVLEYDGNNWNLIEIANDRLVRSLDIDSLGRIFVGGRNEFGYLTPNEFGELTYKSLSEDLPDELKGFQDIWNTFCLEDGVLFQASKHLYKWSKDSIQVIDLLPAPNKEQSKFQAAYRLDGQIYLHQMELGLLQYHTDGSLTTLDGGELIASNRVYGMISHELSGKHLVLSRDSGTYALDPSSKVLEKYPMPFDELLAQKNVYHVQNLSKEYIAIGTFSDGVYITSKSGELIYHVNKEEGLVSEVVHHLFEDSYGNLWMALQNGIAMVDVQSPVQQYNDGRGLRGNIQSITRFADQLHVATLVGVFRLNAISGRFDAISGIDIECWDLLTYPTPDGDTVLLVATNDNVQEVTPNGNATLLYPAYPWSFAYSPDNPRLVYVGLDNGLTSMEWNAGQWIKNPSIPQVTETCHNLSIDEEGHLWIGTMSSGVIEFYITSYGDTVVNKYNQKHGLPSGFTYVEIIEGAPVFGTDHGIYQFNRKLERFELAPLFEKSELDSTKAVHRLRYDAKQNRLWAIFDSDHDGFQFGYTSLEEEIDWKLVQFSQFREEIPHGIFHDLGEISWVGGEGGLLRYNPKAKKAFEHSFKTLIRKVELTGDSVIFAGTFSDGPQISLEQPSTKTLILPYASNSIVFHFVAPFFQKSEATVYKWKLDGFHTDWTDWKRELKATFTNLSEGDYTFHVKSKNLYGQESEVGTYQFTVLPPWYRTWWAYVIYGISFLGFVRGAIVFSTRRLKVMIDNATQEIVEQKEEIEVQKQIVEAKNKDITDSIEYASTIQSAILPSPEILESFMPEHFVFFRPRDIVSGDFYWINKLQNGKTIIAAADCTGHGVPGAFMSMIGNSLLNEIIIENRIDQADEILNRLKAGIIKALNQEEEGAQSKDGMDIALSIIDHENGVLSFAGANNPMYIVRPGEEVLEVNGTNIEPNIEGEAQNLFEIKGDKQPIGYHTDKIEPFTRHQINFQKGDTFYLFSDGFADQFGGLKGKKFKYKPFKQLILSIYERSMQQQGEALEKALLKWKGDFEQIDDIVLIGVRL